jgi:hypothetical protein
VAHKRFVFDLPASAEVAFDVFHYHVWRARWDSLVSDTKVVGGAPCPCVGAITQNEGGGLLRGLSMRTQFVSYDRPRIAAAAMPGRSFPFTRWAASMQHKAVDGERSTMIYTYTFETGPGLLRWLIEPVTQMIFDRQTRRRFARMSEFLRDNSGAVKQWQQSQRVQPDECQ